MVRLSRIPEKININSHIKDIQNYFSNRAEIAAAFLFGSYGTQYQTPLSDVDIAILYIPGTPVDIKNQLEIMSDLADITGEEDINVVVLNKAPLTVQFEVLKTGKILVKKELYLEDFHEYVCKRYADFKIDLDQFNADYDSALREVYLSGQSG
ncbi:type VII toxin-antitoxin system MntA family adenylyltransferase antitoxin [Dethiobacter alkaliphilus]|uniref:DNA polymerase beta domain protein region n=1 Tax=Dethiobacter alkaliphilus AHT 1 TaxID=555088 RepID=C0GFC6_DETAL|nr:nucleotidyltransferase domain-containing protein [Dethiobacter alkaliphilus]EEG77886.1 DNA polymerase beta domain protein region [Dethiobacter alkaliphilus AHT 1]